MMLFQAFILKITIVFAVTDKQKMIEFISS